MSATVPNYRWSTSEFVRTWEAGAFDHRVQFAGAEISVSQLLARAE